MSRLLFLSALVAGGLLAAAPGRQPLHRPLIFEPNRGQAQPQVKWIAQGAGYQIHFTEDALTMVFREKDARSLHTLEMKLVGSQLWSHFAGLDATGGVSNYLNRPNGAASLTGIPHYGRLKVSDVYPGIDLVFYNDSGNLEYDFVLRPGADPKQIQVAFGGQNKVRLDHASGDLILVTPSGSELRQISPKVYQQIGNRRVAVAGSYQLLNNGRVAFSLAAYDPRRPLTIDPTIQLV